MKNAEENKNPLQIRGDIAIPVPIHPQNSRFADKETQHSLFRQRLLFYPCVNGLISSGSFFQFYYIRYSSSSEEDFLAQGVVIVFLWILITYSYFKASLTVPAVSKPDKNMENNNNLLANYANVIKDKDITPNINTLMWKDCEFCKAKKFERSSHCRTCNRCILARDHHCMWIANCVGFDNIQYFFIFCFWIVVGISYYMLGLIFFLMNYSEIITQHPHARMGTVIFILFLIDSFILFLVLTGVFGILARLLFFFFYNQTYLETLRQPKINIYNEYNVGFLTNFYYLFGPTLFHAVFPLRKCNYIPLKENSPIFAKIKQPAKIELIRGIREKDPLLVENSQKEEAGEMDPKNFMENAHKKYDKLRIV